jgi:hypothetical protein
MGKILDRIMEITPVPDTGRQRPATPATRFSRDLPYSNLALQVGAQQDRNDVVFRLASCFLDKLMLEDE